MTTTFDQALHATWARDTETETEREEREAVERGQIFGLLTDAEWTAHQDIVAWDYAEWSDAMMDPWGRAWHGATFVPNVSLREIRTYRPEAD